MRSLNSLGPPSLGLGALRSSKLDPWNVLGLQVELQNAAQWANLTACGINLEKKVKLEIHIFSSWRLQIPPHAFPERARPAKTLILPGKNLASCLIAFLAA